MLSIENTIGVPAHYYISQEPVAESLPLKVKIMDERESKGHVPIKYNNIN